MHRNLSRLLDRFQKPFTLWYVAVVSSHLIRPLLQIFIFRFCTKNQILEFITSTAFQRVLFWLNPENILGKLDHGVNAINNVEEVRQLPAISLRMLINLFVGQKSRRVSCRNTNTGAPVQPDLCDSTRVPSGTESCGNEPCSIGLVKIIQSIALFNYDFTIFRWQASQWSQCDAQCGSNGAQYRSVYCSQIVGGVPAVLNDNLCEGELPQRARACEGPSICPSWFIGQWGSVGLHF